MENTHGTRITVTDNQSISMISVGFTGNFAFAVIAVAFATGRRTGSSSSLEESKRDPSDVFNA